MDLNGDGHHDWKDDAMLGFIAGESDNQKPPPQRSPQGSGCGTIFVAILVFCCLLSAISNLLR